MNERYPTTFKLTRIFFSDLQNQIDGCTGPDKIKRPTVNIKMQIAHFYWVLIPSLGAFFWTTTRIYTILMMKGWLYIYIILQKVLHIDCLCIHVTRMRHNTSVNTLRPRQKAVILHTTVSNVLSSMKINEFRLKLQLNVLTKIQVLVLIMACCRPGDKPLSELMLVRLLMHICLTQPQWVKQCVNN